jgi:hypothetical protein
MQVTLLTASRFKAVIFKIIPIFLLCMVKFVVGVPALYAATKWGFLPMFIVSSAAGICGVVAFLFFEQWIFKAWDWLKMKYFPPKSQPQKKKLFTKKNRLLVKILSTYGLPGIAFITPTIISIPVGSILAGRLYTNNKKVFVYLSVSVILWSALLSGLLTLGN